MDFLNKIEIPGSGQYSDPLGFAMDPSTEFGINEEMTSANQLRMNNPSIESQAFGIPNVFPNLNSEVNIPYADNRIPMEDLVEVPVKTEEPLRDIEDVDIEEELSEEDIEDRRRAAEADMINAQLSASRAGAPSFMDKDYSGNYGIGDLANYNFNLGLNLQTKF